MTFLSHIHRYCLDCQLRGNLPPWINELTELIDIQLSDNDFTGPLPPLNNLTKLELFSVGDNDFSGPIPDLSNSLNLTELSLGRNRFSGNLPPTLGNLKKLEALYLFENRNLTGSLDVLASMDSLEVFRGESCQFTGNLSSSLGDLKSFRYFDITGNHITGPLPVGLSGNDSRTLKFNDNCLTGQYNGSAIANQRSICPAFINIDAMLATNVSGSALMNETLVGDDMDTATGISGYVVPVVIIVALTVLALAGFVGRLAWVRHRNKMQGDGEDGLIGHESGKKSGYGGGGGGGGISGGGGGALAGGFGGAVGAFASKLKGIGGDAGSKTSSGGGFAVLRSAPASNEYEKLPEAEMATQDHLPPQEFSTIPLDVDTRTSFENQQAEQRRLIEKGRPIPFDIVTNNNVNKSHYNSNRFSIDSELEQRTTVNSNALSSSSTTIAASFITPSQRQTRSPQASPIAHSNEPGYHSNRFSGTAESLSSSLSSVDPYVLEKRHPNAWSKEDVSLWLRSSDFDETVIDFFVSQDIDGKLLVLFTPEQIRIEMQAGFTLKQRLSLQTSLARLCAKWGIPYTGSVGVGSPIRSTGDVEVDVIPAPPPQYDG
jgi:hypothetical protein